MSLPAIAPPSQSFKFDVAVDTKSGQPVTNLHQQDFTVLDNKTPRPITSFKIVTPGPGAGPRHPFRRCRQHSLSKLVAYVREGVEKFLKANEGTLANPTAVAVLTDQGAQIDSRLLDQWQCSER